MRTSVFACLSLMLSTGVAARAQEPAAPAVPPTPATAPVAPTPPSVPVPPIAVAGAAMSGPKWLEEKVNVDINDSNVADAIKRVLDAAKASMAKVDSDFSLPADLKVSLKVSNVSARDVLASVARLGGAVAYVSEEDGKSTVYLRKRTVAVAPPAVYFNTAPSTTFPRGYNADIQRSVNEALKTARGQMDRYRVAGDIFTFPFGLAPAMSEKRVSLDAKNKNVRDVLQDVLKQAGVDYALEDDIPDEKKSFTFENVPLNTALDVICQSVGLGWRAEQTAPDRSEKDPKKQRKIVVRVGKKYARTVVPSRRTSWLAAPHGLPEIHEVTNEHSVLPYEISDVTDETDFLPFDSFAPFSSEVSVPSPAPLLPYIEGEATPLPFVPCEAEPIEL